MTTGSSLLRGMIVGFVATLLSFGFLALALPPKGEGHVRMTVAVKNAVPGEITVSQIGRRGVEGGVTVRLGKPEKGKL